MQEYRRSSKKNIRCQPLSSISEHIFRNSLLDCISFPRYFTVICFQSNYDNEQNAWNLDRKLFYLLDIAKDTTLWIPIMFVHII